MPFFFFTVRKIPALPSRQSGNLSATPIMHRPTNMVKDLRSPERAIDATIFIMLICRATAKMHKYTITILLYLEG